MRLSRWRRAALPGRRELTRGARRGVDDEEGPRRIRRGPSDRRGSEAARELLPQCGERLVRGERALDRRGLGAVGGRRRVGARLRLRLARVLDLLAVGLPARVGLGVLPLPLFALLLVALEPVVGLRVEALGVLVVALLVVLRRHAVQARVEVGTGGRDALVGLLERQRDPATLWAHLDDLAEDAVADLADLLRDLDVALGQLRDVDQALDALVDADERAEGHQLGDLAGDDLADRVGPGELLPRVLLRRLERQRDALAVHVDVQDLDRDLLADLDDLGRVVDVLPGQLRHVHQAVDPAEVDERPEVDDGGDDARTDLAL